LVFRYEYVWKRQHSAGQRIGEKERPACIVAAIIGASGKQKAMILPITTQRPGDETAAIEIPPKVKQHLGLDPARTSWIILDEANLDIWPSPDMRPIPGSPGLYEYGLLPERLTNAVRQAISSAINEKRLATIDRADIKA